MRLVADRTPWTGAIELRAGFRRGNDWVTYTPGELRVIAPNDFVAPFCSLDPTGAQELMDSLWQCGLRPTEGTGSAGSLAASQAHVKDLSAITHKLLEKLP